MKLTSAVVPALPPVCQVFARALVGITPLIWVASKPVRFEPSPKKMFPELENVRGELSSLERLASVTCPTMEEAFTAAAKLASGVEVTG